MRPKPFAYNLPEPETGTGRIPLPCVLSGQWKRNSTGEEESTGEAEGISINIKTVFGISIPVIINKGFNHQYLISLR
jgi:hypothetical protein